MSDLINLLTNNGDLSLFNFLILCLSSFVTSTITASFGLGGGALLILIMVNILNPLVIIPIHAVIQISSNSTRALMLRKNINYKFISPFIIGSLVGVSIAGIILIDLPKFIIQSLIGIFILYSLYIPQAKNIKITKWSIGLIGTISSFLTMFVGASGPIMAPFIRSFTENRQSTVATQAAFMTWKHGIKIIVFIILGFSFENYIPLGGVTDSSKMAQQVLYLCSAAADVITGDMLIADGGQWLVGNAFYQAGKQFIDE